MVKSLALSERTGVSHDFVDIVDQQNSTEVVADSTGAVTELSDYYAYGNIRQDTQTTGSTFNEQKKYISQYADTATTGLDYLNARYYDGRRGQFLSEDPQFWSQSQNLRDPQSLNSYSYARNNPINLSDPSGKIFGIDDSIEAYVALGLLSMIGAGFAAILHGGATGNTKEVEMGFAAVDTGTIGGAGTLGSGPSVPDDLITYGSDPYGSGIKKINYYNYGGVDSDGNVCYVGQTTQNPQDRFDQHANAIGTGRESLNYSVTNIASNPTSMSISEQQNINYYGLQNNGGQLINRINSVSTSNPMSSFTQNISGPSNATILSLQIQVLQLQLQVAQLQLSSYQKNK